jgi:hypothetical protein
VHTRRSSRLRAWIGEDWRIYVAKIAFAPAHTVSPAELSDALREWAGRSARGIVEGIEEAILEREAAAEPRDDIVLLVLRLPARECRWPHPARAADRRG